MPAYSESRGNAGRFSWFEIEMALPAEGAIRTYIESLGPPPAPKFPHWQASRRAEGLWAEEGADSDHWTVSQEAAAIIAEM